MAMAHYWASCAGGLEFVLIKELEQLEGITVNAGIQSYGGVQFQTTSSPQKVAQLRSADNVYAFLAHYKNIPLEKEAGVTFMKSLPTKVDWNPVMQLHQQWQDLKRRETGGGTDDGILTINGVGRGEDSHAAPEITFRVTGDRISMKLKKQGYTSMDAAAAIGDGIYESLGWPADMRSFKVEVLAWIIDDELLLVLALIYSGNKKKDKDAQDGGDAELTTPSHIVQEESTEAIQQPTSNKKKSADRPSRADAQLYSKRPYRQALVHTSLKPSTAYALLQLAQIQPGDIILDPMCGCGTIPLEAGDWLGNSIVGLAGDLVDRAVESSRINSTGDNSGHRCDVVQWDAGLLPLRTASIDRVISDMPFGNRCGNFKVRDWLCPRVVKQVVRVLRPGTGLAVLMAQSKTMKDEVLLNQKVFLDLEQHLLIDMEDLNRLCPKSSLDTEFTYKLGLRDDTHKGLRVDVFVVLRTLEPAPEQVVRMGKNMVKRKRDWQQTKNS